MKRHLQYLLASAALGALAVMAATGCKRDEVQVYHVDTNETVVATAPASAPAPDQSVPPAMPSTMPPGLAAPDNSNLPQLKYTLPDGWKEKAPSQMRVASFGISQDGKSVDVSVVPLSGTGGGDFANVNRWRGQVGLQAADDGAIQQAAQNVSVGTQPASLYDIAGASQRIIAAILHSGDTVWFFKMDGDPDLTENNKAAFISFLQSMQFTGNAAPATVMDASQLPPSHPAIDDASAVSSDISSIAKPAWTVPASWQEGPLEQFLVAKFIIAGTGDAKAEVNVSSLAGDGGGLGPNINRWRGQLGLSLDDNLATTSLDVLGGRAQVVDLTGTDANTGKPARLIGVIVPEGSQTWFYKLMGDPDVVSQQKDAFTGFVQMAKYPDAH